VKKGAKGSSGLKKHLREIWKLQVIFLCWANGCYSLLDLFPAGTWTGTEQGEESIHCQDQYTVRINTLSGSIHCQNRYTVREGSCASQLSYLQQALSTRIRVITSYWIPGLPENFGQALVRL